jgi:hypothetical protein
VQVQLLGKAVGLLLGSSLRWWRWLVGLLHQRLGLWCCRASLSWGWRGLRGCSCR